MIMVCSSSSQSLFKHHPNSTASSRHLEKLFLYDFLRQLMPAKNFPRAQVVASATMLEKGQRNLANHLEILKSYIAEREAACPAPQLIDLSTSIRICRFNDSVEPFIQHFVGSSAGFLALHRYSLCIDSLPVSYTERWRLQRAFYHFQLHAYHNNEDSSGVSELSALEQTDYLIGKLPKFQIDQLSCILTYIAGRLNETYEQFEDTFVSSLISEMDEPESTKTRTQAQRLITQSRI